MLFPGLEKMKAMEEVGVSAQQNLKKLKGMQMIMEPNNVKRKGAGKK